MKQYKLVVSKDAPSVRDAVWARPVVGGFTFYILDGGKWRTMKIVNDKNTPDPIDDVVENLIGSGSDDKDADTINGAKAYADDAVATAITSLGQYLSYAGAVSSESDLPTDLTSSDNGTVYMVDTAGTYAGKSLQIGDSLIWNGTSWDAYATGS